MQVGLILAAGSGSRMGRPKAALEINGERLVDRAVTIFHEAGIKKVYVVLGAWQGYVPGAHVLINPDWESGMGSSLATGLNSISEDLENTDVVISLVDLPGMTAAAIRKISDASQEIAVGQFGGKSGHPVKFTRNHWQSIIDSVEGDVGARTYLKGRDDVFFIELGDLAVGIDVDTQADLENFGGQQ
jgi:nicotine blue oxidoreductase